MPESAQKDLNEAKVLAVGPGALDKEGKRVPMSVREGDRVLIPTVSLLDFLVSFVGGWRREKKKRRVARAMCDVM